MSVEAGQIVREALGAWLLGLNLSPVPDVVGEAPVAGDRPALPHVGIAWGPVTSTDERILAETFPTADDTGTRASGTVLVRVPASASGETIPVGTRFNAGAVPFAVTTSAGILYAPPDISDVAFAVVEARAVAVGAIYNMPIDTEIDVDTTWGAGAITIISGFHNGVDGDPENPAAAATWLLGSDEVQARFMLRATTPEDADSLAHQFRGRFALEACRSNDGGDPVLHFTVAIAGEDRTGKVYLDGTFTPPVQRDVSTASLYEQAVGALVVFPRFWVEELGDESGQLDVTITLNGVAYTPPSGIPEE